MSTNVSHHTAFAWLRALNPQTGEGGGSQPHLFDTDGGQFLVKARNNPQGLPVLANELIGSLCLDWLRVSHPRGAVVDLPAALLDVSPGAVFADGTRLAPGESFGSEFWQSDPPAAVDPNLISNKGDVGGTLVYDTWIRQHDSRQYRLRPSGATPRRYDFIPVDQGHSFGNPAWTPDGLGADRVVDVPGAIVPIAGTDVEAFVDRLRTFERPDAEAIVRQVPSGWLGADERKALIEYLAARAPLAAAAIEGQFPKGVTT